MRILITGGTGFIGSALGLRLVAAGHEVFCACRPRSSVAFGEAVVWNAVSPDATSTFPESIEAVVHLAQSRRYRHFPADSREMFDVNIGMTMSLLQWAARSSVKQFCLVSSGAVYEPFTGSLQEDAAVVPHSFLGASKLASEIISRPFSGLFKLNILRLFFPYGPGQRGRLVPDLIRRIRCGEAVQVTENGEGMRLVPTFVDDIVDVVLASIESSWTGTMNVATPEALSIRQIAELIGRQLGIEPKLEIVDRTPIDVIPDLDRLAGRFDMRRFTRFEEGLCRTIAAHPGEDAG
jgi:UDP-glucose 4-epimerase